MYLPDGDIAVLENSGLKPSSIVSAPEGNEAKALGLNKVTKNTVTEASVICRRDRDFFISSISSVS